MKVSCEKKAAALSYKHGGLGGRTSIIITTIGLIIVFYGVFVIYPILYAFFGSLHEWNPMIGKLEFKGMGNYTRALTDSVFWISMLNTVYFTAVVVFLRTAIGLWLAVKIYSVEKFRNFFKISFFVTAICSLVAVSVLWKVLYDPMTGLFNVILSFFGFEGLGYLKDPVQALPSIMVMTVWKDVGYAMVIFMSGLLSIPASFFEAAKIDGATKGQVFWKVTFPLLRPTTVFILVTSMIAYMQTFTQIIVMTDEARGGPGTSCFTTVFYLFQEAFSRYDFGYAASISFLFFIIVMAFSLVQIKLYKQDWEY